MKEVYHHTEEIHNFSAAREVVPLIMKIVKPESVLDVGCGLATWLKVFEDQGITDYLGIDGDYVDRKALKISEQKFEVRDLSQPWSLSRKFDLVLSLEVAEHLPAESADLFVETLAQHGEEIIFSAAVPGQGGQHHLNEQWPEYWQQKFEKYGFYFHDVIRPLIWNNPKVEWWYRQNIFLLRRQPPQLAGTREALALVHPELYLLKSRNEQEYIRSLVSGKQGLTLALRMLWRALKFKLKRV